jgi:hypothetical protein
MTYQRRAVMRAMVMAIGAVAAATAGTALAQQGQGNLPFSSVYRRPAISPYNQIANFSNNPLQASNIYQQIVVPQLQQQQQQVTQLQQARQMSRLQSQVQQIQRDTSSRQVDESIRPTGHQATFQNLSHFYPQQRQR